MDHPTPILPREHAVYEAARMGKQREPTKRRRRKRR